MAIISDIIKPLIKKTLNSNQEIKLIRFATFIIGCFAIIFATSSTSIIDLIFNAWMIWAPIVTIPLYAAILGIKSNFTTFLVSGIAGICTLFFWEIFHVEDITNIANTIPALLTNFITFAACTFYFYKYNPHKLFQFTRMMRQNATSKINSKKNIMIV